MGQQIITQALFSTDGKRIIYCAAAFWGSYSPVGPKDKHELDVFSINLDGSAQIQHSRFKAYHMGNIRLFKAPATYFVNINDPRQKLSGTYVFSLDEPEQLRLVKDDAAAVRGLDYLPNFTVSSQGQVAFSIKDELFTKNMKTGSTEPVGTVSVLSHPIPMAFIGKTNAILLSETLLADLPNQLPTFRFSVLNLDDLSTQLIPLKIE